MVAEVIRPEDVNLWMFEPNKLLGGDTPADPIRNGRYNDVLAVIEALACCDRRRGRRRRG